APRRSGSSSSPSASERGASTWSRANARRDDANARRDGRPNARGEGSPRAALEICAKFPRPLDGERAMCPFASMTSKTSSIPRFRELSLGERRARLAASAGIDAAELARIVASGGLDDAGADAMVENAIGTLALPFGVGLHFR